jgi:hypothetical protein
MNAPLGPWLRLQRVRLPTRKNDGNNAYLARGKRKWKRFDDPYAARRFCLAKEKAGAEPYVVRVAL